VGGTGDRSGHDSGGVAVAAAECDDDAFVGGGPVGAGADGGQCRGAAGLADQSEVVPDGALRFANRLVGDDDGLVDEVSHDLPRNVTQPAGVGNLVRRIAESDILSADELDLLAQTFLAAGDAVYWQVPEEWFGDDSFEIVIDVADGDEPGNGVDSADGEEPAAAPQPVVARRDVLPPLRRWAAARAVSQTPESLSALLARSRELDARGGAAVLGGLLDSVGELEPVAQQWLIDVGTRWPDQAVRLLALGLLAERQGAEAAHRVAQHDSSARVRTWAAKLLTTTRHDDCQPASAGSDETQPPPTLF
jgi:hypothetical protein